MMEVNLALKSIDGMPVIDARMGATITVTDGDIKDANRKEPDECVLARAARRSLHAKEVRVHLTRVYVRTNTSWLRYITPKYLRQEMVAFDRGGKFIPGEYGLSPPPPSKRANGHRQGSEQPPRPLRAASAGAGVKTVTRHYVSMIRTGPGA